MKILKVFSGVGIRPKGHGLPNSLPYLLWLFKTSEL